MSNSTISLTYEQVMDSIREAQKVTQKAIQDFVKDTNLAMQEVAEQQKKTQKAIEETQKQHKETEKAIKETQKQMGKLGNRFGEVTEHMVFPAVVSRFNELGYRFHTEFEGNFKVINKKNKLIAEIDAYLENDTTIAVVEIKAKPNEEDIEAHIQRIEKLKQNRQEFNDPPKIIIGAIAGAVFPAKIKAVAIKAGFYVLVQSGDTMKLDIPQNFKPREF
ncbi:MAG: tektin family protein [Planctomycetaceae bacterium]|jgi:hypothetical protein|nr:tektin family protein [Planctomycetaceae bacterium]